MVSESSGRNDYQLVLDRSPDSRLEFELFAGAVGTAAATEFCGFLKMGKSHERMMLITVSILLLFVADGTRCREPGQGGLRQAE